MDNWTWHLPSRDAPAPEPRMSWKRPRAFSGQAPACQGQGSPLPQGLPASTYTQVCMYVCMCLGMYGICTLSVSPYIYIYTAILKYIERICRGSFTDPILSTPVSLYMHIYVHRYIYIYIYIDMYICMYVHTHVLEAYANAYPSGSLLVL